MTTDTNEITDSEVDSLLQSVEAPTPERAMTEAPEPEQKTETPPAAPATPQEYEFQYNGRQIKAPVDKILQWASQGYDYPQKMAELNKQRESWQSKQTELEQKYSPYKQIDEFATKNKAWWDHVQQSYQQRAQILEQNNPLAREIEPLKNELQELKQFKDQIIQKEQTQVRQAEDSKLDQDVQSIRKEFAYLDFDKTDQDGKTLEYRVLEFANKNNIPDFRAAFLALNHERIVKLAEERGKEQVLKDKQKTTKLGLLGTSQAPRKSVSEATDIANKSMDDLYNEALQELGIG